MKYKVWHSISPKPFLNPKIAPRLFYYFRNKYYVAIANIEANSLEEVFEIGQKGWGNYDSRVTMLKFLEQLPRNSPIEVQPLHSTSVGDVVEDEQGNYWVCDYLGWVEVHNYLFNPLAKK